MFPFLFPRSITYISRDAKSRITAIRVSRDVFNFQTVGRIPIASIASVAILKMTTGYHTLPWVVHSDGTKTQGCGN
jgi:hypothetical protein